MTQQQSIVNADKYFNAFKEFMIHNFTLFQGT